MTSQTSIVQWNAQGLRNKKSELLELIHDNCASIVAIQETRLSNDFNLKNPNYNLISKDGHFNHGQHGGVSLYIHSDVPYREIPLSTPIQAVAAEIRLQFNFSICNIYSSRSHPISKSLLTNILQQLTSPCLIVGDFNAYSSVWHCSGTDTRGRAVEGFLQDNNLVLLNDNSPTRIGYNSETTIDLSICSPSISLALDWEVLSSPRGSDHCPIIIKLPDTENPSLAPSWSIKRANWEIFSACPSWNNLPPTDGDKDLLLDDFYSRLMNACDEGIPKYTPCKFYPKPWWTPELRVSKQKREHHYQKYRRSRNVEDLYNWKRARAQHKNNVRKAKELSFREKCTTLKYGEPPEKFYRTMKSFKGIKPKSIHILKENSQTYSSHQQIADKLAQTMAKISSTSNYHDNFLPRKRVVEDNLPDFGNSSQYYNRPISPDEFNFAISNSTDSAPGYDQIYYSMIKNLPPPAKSHLLAIFNKFFLDSFFPEKWEHSIIFPIPKPGKNHYLSDNYRPIALTSCLCKLLEKILNERLHEFLDINKVLTNIQCGGRRGRSTLDHLVRLEAAIRKAFLHREHFISIFFDLERAYDMTWRGGILQDLYDAGLRGLLPKFIAAFLRKRTFCVQVGSTRSTSMIQENGVPQGSVLSVTLFAIKINSIMRNLPENNRLTASLFVDDLQVGCRDSDPLIIKRQLQTVLNKLNAWSHNNGFKFSSSKTCVVHFVDSPNPPPSPDLYLGSDCLPYKNHTKFLGLVWDRRLTWRPFINQLRGNCTKLLNLLKTVTSLKWGADQFCCLKIYKTYIRSKIDYGAPVYGSACRTLLSSLEPICREALRLASGAFKSTPVESLHALCGEVTLEERREFLSMRYYCKIKSFLSNPAFTAATRTSDSLLFSNRNIAKPLSLRVPEYLHKYGLPRFFIQPEFSYPSSNIRNPTTSLMRIDFNRDLLEHPKSTTSHEFYRQAFGLMIEENYKDYLLIFTDGSRSAAGVGSAYYSSSSSASASLPRYASIFSAELHALYMAVSAVQSSFVRKCLVLSDSCSVLLSLANPRSRHPIVRKLIHLVDTIRRSRREIKFCWIPSHVGILGNERADQAAVRASKRAPELIPIYYGDCYRTIHAAYTKFTSAKWTQSRTKLHEVFDVLENIIYDSSLTRREQVVLNRLRLGHCLFSHQYLMESDPSPECAYCHSEIMSVKHVMTSCPSLRWARSTFMPDVFSGLESVNIEKVLGNKCNVSSIFDFMSNIGLINNI